MSRFFSLCSLLLAAVPAFAAKDTPVQTLDWPGTGAQVLRFNFSKFSEVGSGIGKERGYVVDVTAQNVSSKLLDSVNLTLYVFDKKNIRIGDGLINLSHVQPAETVRFELNFQLSGTPNSVSLAESARQMLSITINSVPQGAEIRLDGKDVGTTPKLVDVAVGKHVAEFNKDGYNTGQYPFELGPRDVDGGNISYELGVSALDTVELRDGTVLSGDLIAISGMNVELRIGGEVKTFDRNQVKRISLTQRQPPS